MEDAVLLIVQGVIAILVQMHLGSTPPHLQNFDNARMMPQRHALRQGVVVVQVQVTLGAQVVQRRGAGVVGCVGLQPQAVRVHHLLGCHLQATEHA